MIEHTEKLSIPSQEILAPYMEESATRHRHLCPRQILGVRMGLYGLQRLGMIDHDYLPRYFNKRKQLLTIVETDGCGADGIAVVTGCFVGRRTLRVLDFGKMAATLVDTKSGSAVRVTPQPQARELARISVPNARSRWHAYLEAYQYIADEKLLQGKEVILNQSIAEILSKPYLRTVCDWCGEEIMNGREVDLDGHVACRSCAGENYFKEL